MEFHLVHGFLLFAMFLLALVLTVGFLLLRQDRLERRLDLFERLGAQQRQPEALVYDPRTQQSMSLQDFQGDPLSSLSSWESRLTPKPKMQDENGDIFEELTGMDDM